VCYKVVFCVSSILLSFVAAAQTVALIVPAIDDASIALHSGFNSDDCRYGTAGHLSVISLPGKAGWGENISRCLINFDWNAIADDIELISSHLILTTGQFDCGNVYPTYGQEVAIKRIVSPWDERNVTWNSKPLASQNNPMNFKVENAAELAFDITNLVTQTLANRETSWGFEIYLTDTTIRGGLQFWSSNSAKPPILIVNYKLKNNNVCQADCGSTFQVNPNPVFSRLRLTMSACDRDSYICVYNALGQVVRHTTLEKEATKLDFDVSSLPAGTYYVRRNNGAAVVTEKFVKVEGNAGGLLIR
jgi:hypothetical protein